MITSPASSDQREARDAWLVDLLHYAIQFHVYAEAKREDVAQIIDSLSDSDEYDDNVAALVQMPKWSSPCEAQDAVDRHFHRSPAPSEDAAREAPDLRTVEFPYQATFNAIGDAVEIKSDTVLSISVEKFQSSLRAALAQSPAPAGDVSDMPDADLIRRAIGSLRRLPKTERARTEPLWVKVGRRFALGSTYSGQLCRRFGFDPNEQVRP